MPRRESNHRKLCQRYDVEGHAHYQTFSCLDRRPFLTSDRACRWFLEGLNKARVEHSFELWAFVLMPEHVHLLILPHKGVKVSRILQAAKQPVAQKVVAWVRDNKPSFLPTMGREDSKGKVHYLFWLPGGGYDRNIYSVEELHEKIKYIHNNPVRRGLVERPEDWPWSSCRAWMTGIDEPIRIDREFLPPLIT